MYGRTLRNGDTHFIGFDAVGPGWHPILDELDHQFVMITGMDTSEHMKVKVLQIKEKFGQLRIYCDFRAFDEGKRKLLAKAVADAEDKSATICEVCGQPGTQAGKWVKTFCAEHHRVQEETGKSPLQEFWDKVNDGTADGQKSRPRT
jgi:hypothetical protein